MKSSFSSNEEWSVTEYGCAMWSMEMTDYIRKGEARLRSSLDLFLQSLVLKVKDFSAGCVWLKRSMSDSLAISFVRTDLLCL